MSDSVKTQAGEHTTGAPTVPESAATRAGVVAKLFREHNRDLVRFIQARLGGLTGDASEVAQEAYVRLLQLENTGAVSFLRAYLFRIAANLVIDRLGARKRSPEDRSQSSEALDQVADPFDVERAVLAADEYNLFIDCLKELPPKCRQAFVLHRMRQLTSEEVAVQMGISGRMVRKHVARAMIYCRYRLDGLSQQAALERLGDDT
jgi:RNA polymerase sigma-70 factor (ECF subfamily)